MAEKKYTKTLVLKTSTGEKTFTGSQAFAVQRRLDDSKMYWHFTTDEDTGEETYYGLNPNTCGLCEVAVLTPGSTSANEIPCEDPLPNCQPSIAIADGSISVVKSETAKTSATVSGVALEDVTIDWKSSNTAVATVAGTGADATITGVAAGTATVSASFTYKGVVYIASADVTVTEAA